jgi:hypothetical protein
MKFSLSRLLVLFDLSSSLVVVLIYFGYTVTGPYALNTKQLIHLKIIAENYEQVRSKISMLAVDEQ